MKYVARTFWQHIYSIAEETCTTSSYRLCHLVKWENFQGYGFTVDSDSSGHYIRTVVETSPADAAGLRQGNKVIESETYGCVIERILSSKKGIEILVDDNVAPAPKKTDDVTINMEYEVGTNQNSVPAHNNLIVNPFQLYFHCFHS
ncbi:hypothetical protein CHS0354_034607 [Potamilus streckersoni]|uniref:PDZ domain-containing protein n=1 Tax=Potamilus streckersoni TaxID=2493646 RepID=A0AAE0SSZ7_9BIVA|nr:hypothetical protein CHS0354_034607 [Potamilus streckersoni]